MDDKAGWLAITIVTTFAVASRWPDLGQASLTGDEIYTVQFAAERIHSLINPAYYALTLLSFKLFGVSEFSARLPAMLLGALSVPIYFVTWRNLIGRNAALIGALVIVFSAWHLWYSQFSRFYTGAFLFGSLSYYLFYQALLRDDLLRLAGALLAATVGFLFHATVIMVPVAFGAYALLVSLRPAAAQAGLSRRISNTYLALCAIGALGAAVVLWNVWQTRQGRGITWGDSPAEMVLQIVHYVQLPLVVTAFFGLLVQLRRDAWLGLYFLIGIALPAAFVIGAAAFLNSRSVYLFYALPLIITLAAVVCEEARRALVSQYRFASHALTLLLFATLTPEFVSHYTARNSLDVRDAVAFIQKQHHSGDAVISFLDEFDYYARGKFSVIPGFAQARVAKSGRTQALNAIIAEHPRAWLVVDSYRKPISHDLQTWLGEHASLVWRRSETRYDYNVRGLEIYRIASPPPANG